MPLDCGAHRMRDNGERYYKATCTACQEMNENVKYSRAFQFVVYVDRAWLTADFEYDEESGWGELRAQLIERLTVPLWHGANIRIGWDAEIWAEEPVEEK